ncbi:MAG: hypothetical protein ACOX3W_08210 [Christensenellaceae bacterium]
MRQATAPTITSDNYTSIVSEDGGTFQVLADGFGYTAPSYTTSGAVPPSGFSLDEDSGLMAFASRHSCWCIYLYNHGCKWRRT